MIIIYRWKSTDDYDDEESDENYSRIINVLNRLFVQHLNQSFGQIIFFFSSLLFECIYKCICVCVCELISFLFKFKRIFGRQYFNNRCYISISFHFDCCCCYFWHWVEKFHFCSKILVFFLHIIFIHLLSL